ncbi:MAG: hypothetical protein M1838_005344 [Thelocarpon superellum]|nr:MAG: hypothetical protein M1838_005344 [Thelocarpon superellum]
MNHPALAPPQPQHPAHARPHGNMRSRSGDHRHLTANGANAGANGIAVPNGPLARVGNGHGPARGMAGGPFDGPRSPPGGKNTSHVPCKFFRQGACQAGKACPFSHSVDATTVQTPCKYFAKGNCKFGAKCALAHILPDGRRVNRPSMSMGGGHLNLGGRVNPETYHNQGSALANSLLQANMGPAPFGHQYPYSTPDDYVSSPTHPNPTFDIPTIDTSFPVSNPGSKYGSPREEHRSALSPGSKGLSVLDAPLPASFDSNGVSWIARNGPVAASMPSKFGIDSPSPSYKETTALKTLHDSAFGSDGRGKTSQMASSPPGPAGEYFGLRTMHSKRIARPATLSASVPRAGAVDDWDGNFAFEEDFLPNSLQELLTPQEKMRRMSRSGGDEETTRLSGVGSPGEQSSKITSPLASSPSRFGAWFARQKKDEEASMTPSSFGHVGSPLRNSSITLGSSPPRTVRTSATARPASGDLSPYYTSPPRQPSMSMISQQLQRTRLGGSAEPASTTLHPSSARQLSSSASGPPARVSLTSSNPSTGSNATVPPNRSVASIDEEEQGEVFSMEEEDEGAAKRLSAAAAPSHSTNHATPTRATSLGTIGTGRNGVEASFHSGV